MDNEGKKVSRLEKHKKRREGEVTSSATKAASDQVLQESYDVNPIAAKKEDDAAKRKRSYDNILVSKNLDIDEIRKKAKGEKKELFDIEEAFKNLHREHKDYDRDTQLEIMNDIFSDNLVEYNDTIELEKDHHTREITISEDDLIKMLDEKQALNNKKEKKSSLSFPREQKNKQAQPEPNNQTTLRPSVAKPLMQEDLQVKELDLGNRPVAEVFAEVKGKKNDASVTQRITINNDQIKQEKTKSNNIAKKFSLNKKKKPQNVKVSQPQINSRKNPTEINSRKNTSSIEKTQNSGVTLNANTILMIILGVLILFLAYLVYQFIA